MKTAKQSSSGQFVVILLLVFLLGGGGAYYFLVHQRSEPAPIAEAAPAPPAAPEPAPATKPEPAPEPEPEPEPAPSPKPVAATTPEPAPTPEPEPAPAPTPEEKSEIETIMETTYPMPEFKPLAELVEDWNNVPESAFPEEITVNVPVDYQLTSGDKVIGKANRPAGHKARPLKFKPGSLLVQVVGTQDLKAAVPIDDTDFKVRVEELYEKKIADARAQVLRQREEIKKDISSLMAEANEVARKESEPAAPVERTPLTSEVASNYGKEYRGDYMPEVKNGKGDPPDHEIPLGPVGGKAAAFFEKKEAHITELWENGPGAKSGLQVGDVIIKANGKAFKEYGRGKSDDPTGAPEDLGMAMIDAQATGEPLELTIKRGGEEMLVKVTLPPLPPFSETYPVNCARSTALIEGAAQWLADNQKDDGTWPSNDYSSAFCALALLANGDPKHKRQIKNAAKAFADKFEIKGSLTEESLLEPMGGLDNWKQCMVGIFLGEYLLATGDESVSEALLHCSRRLEARLQAETGRLGHSSNKLPYGGKGLVIINVHAHLMWALAAHSSGMEWNWEPWDLSYKAIEASTRDGAVGYNFSAKGGGQSGSRTGSMATALVMADRKTADARTMSGWLKENHRMFPNTHAMTSLGIIYGFMGLKNTSESGYRECLDNYRWMFSLVQPANLSHGSYYYGHRGNHGGDGYCKRRLVGNFTTLMALCSARNDTLWMFGNRERGWYQ